MCNCGNGSFYRFFLLALTGGRTLVCFTAAVSPCPAAARVERWLSCSCIGPITPRVTALCTAAPTASPPQTPPPGADQWAPDCAPWGSAEKRGAVPVLCEPGYAADPSPPGGLSLWPPHLLFLTLPQGTEVGSWCFLSLPLSFQKWSSPQPGRTVTLRPRGWRRALSSHERHTIHLRQSGCPLETTAVFISQLTPCVVRVCVYLNLDF